MAQMMPFCIRWIRNFLENLSVVKLELFVNFYI